MPSARPLRSALDMLEHRIVPAGDAVLQWNDVMLEACKADNAVGYVADEGGPTRAARAMGIVQAAVYDAVNSIDESYTPYLIDVVQAPGASIDAAVAKAAHDTLVAMYPKQTATFDAAYTAALADITSGADAGVAVGAQVAAAILAARANDGSGKTAPYTPGTGALDWQPDPLHPAQKALTAWWGSVTPFTMTSGSEFRPVAPPKPGTPEYEAAFDEVKRLGGDGVTTPTERTEDETEAGIFWGYDGQPGLCTPPRLYNQILVQIARDRGNTEVQNARLLALANLAMADAGIGAWEAKFFYNFARPVTAIRAGDNDGDATTAGDPDWSPLGAPADNGGGTNFTPPFPAYVSGHATFGGAVFETLRKFYGTDNIPFKFLSDEFNGKTFDQTGQARPIHPRHFDTLSQAEEENGQSRIYLGIHWSFDKVNGIKQGNQIADQAFAKFLRAKPETQRCVVGADFGGGPEVKVLGGTDNRVMHDFFAYTRNFTGGVRVAQGDVNGDGVPDIITAAGPGGGPHIKVFDGIDLHVLYNFMAYDDSFRGGGYVAAGDVNGDGFADIVTGAGEKGGPQVEVFSGKDGTRLQSYFALDPLFRGGVRVAVGDLDGDGNADVIATAGTGGGPRVRAFNGLDGRLLRDFMAYDPAFRGGVYIAAGDTNADGLADIITGAGPGGGPHVKVFDAAGAVLQSFYAFSPALQSTKNGVRVAADDIDGDGRADILTGAGRGDQPVIECRNAMDLSMIERTFVFDEGFLGGVNV